jgi:glycine cleavage system pyridoxal-binding protein P
LRQLRPQAEQVKKLLAKIMVSVFDNLFKTQVPIEVDVKICENWGETEGVCYVWLLKLGIKSPSNRTLRAAKAILAIWSVL